MKANKVKQQYNVYTELPGRVRVCMEYFYRIECTENIEIHMHLSLCWVEKHWIYTRFNIIIKLCLCKRCLCNQESEW